MTPIQHHQKLTGLFADANKIEAELEGCFTEGLRKAIVLGRILTEAKSLVGHGDWAAKVRENFNGGIRRAQRWMQVSRAFEHQKAEGGDVAALKETSLRAALKALAAPRKGEIEEPVVTAAEPVAAAADTQPTAAPQLPATAKQCIPPAAARPDLGRVLPTSSARSEAPSPSTPAAAEIVLDQDGIWIPERNREAFAKARSRVLSLGRQVSLLKTHATEELSDATPHASSENDQDLVEQFDSLYSLIVSGHAPHFVCWYCGMDEGGHTQPRCLKCDGNGYLPKDCPVTRYPDTADASFRADLRRWSDRKIADARKRTERSTRGDRAA